MTVLIILELWYMSMLLRCPGPDAALATGREDETTCFLRDRGVQTSNVTGNATRISFLSRTGYQTKQ